MAKHDTSTQTEAKTQTEPNRRHEGEHGTRDRLNDPRSKEGRFSRRHHDAGDSVDDALKGLVADAAKNAQQLPAEQKPTEQDLREAEES
jgi:hypothetical protein